MPMMYWWNGNWGTMLLMMLLNAAVWVGLIALLIWAVSRFFAQRPPITGKPDRGPSALEILRQRYACGEIDEATFEHMRHQLDMPVARDALPIPPGQ